MVYRTRAFDFGHRLNGIKRVSDSNRFPGAGHCHIDVVQCIFLSRDHLDVRRVYREARFLENDPFPQKQFR